MHTSFSPNVAPRTPSDVSVLVEEITSLMDKVNSIDSHFFEVKQRIPVKIPFDPNDDFAQYHKKYLELVWKSREIAGRAGVAGEDFCSDLLNLVSPVNTDSSNLKEKKIRELEIAMGSWRTDGEQESQLSHDFKELSNTLKAFRTAFFDRVAGASEEMYRLRSEIDQLRAEIERMDVCGKSMSKPLFSDWMYLWSTHKSPYFSGIIEASGQHVTTTKEDLRSKISISERSLRDIQLVIDKRDDILAEVDAITVDMDSLAGEVTSLSAILNWMTSECTELLTVMRSDAPVEDLVRPPVSKYTWRLQGAQMVAIRKEFSPIQKSLAAYARAQKS